ncbi:MAG: M48 family metallopeptidase [Zoogloea sp.]|nr:M48 family metallopeptidase [Zoogloea sp.]
MTPTSFSALFLFALVATVLMRLWLATRHLRHVTAHRGAVPPAFAEVIGLDAHQRAADYTGAKVRIGMADILVSAMLVLALTFGGGLQALSDLAAHVAEPGGIVHGVVFIAALGVLSWLVDLPLTLYRMFGIEQRFGFNRMTPALFVADTVKAALLGALIGLPLIAAVLWLMDAMGERWWLWVWAFWLGFNLLVLLLYPTFIAPLFNKFSPLENPELKARIEALAARCGFRLTGLFVMDGSKRSAHGNAYFTGFGAAKRIVFFDTLLEKLSPAEVEAVLAHELGHYRHHHIWKSLAILALASLAMFWLLGQLSGEAWFYQGLGMNTQSTAAALVLFMLALPAFTFPLSPLTKILSRKHEFEADAYAARQASATDLVAALVKLYRDNAATLTPDPLYSTFYDSHPPAALRIARLQSAVAAA